MASPEIPQDLLHEIAARLALQIVRLALFVPAVIVLLTWRRYFTWREKGQ